MVTRKLGGIDLESKVAKFAGCQLLLKPLQESERRGKKKVSLPPKAGELAPTYVTGIYNTLYLIIIIAILIKIEKHKQLFSKTCFGMLMPSSSSLY